jgi:Tol biopolymer transport system component
MATARVPFEGNTSAVIFERILNRDPVPPAEFNAGLPPKLEEVIRTALEKDRDLRYQSAAEMRAELKRLKRDTSSGRIHAASGVTSMASSGSVVAATAPGTKSKTAVLGLIAALLIGIAATVLYFLKGRGPQFSLDKMKIEQVTTSGDATMVTTSPDGRYIVYVRRNGGMESLWMRQVESGGNVQILPPDQVSFKGVRFSPDGAYLYFVRSDKGTANFNYLYQMPVLGGTPRQLVRDIDAAPAFSPDGKQIAYVRGDPTATRLYILIANRDGSGERVLKKVDDWAAVLVPPAWSPDGKTVVVSFDTQKGKEILFFLAAISVADGSMRQLYRSEYSVGTSTWLPDGQGLLFVARDSQRSKEQLWFLSYPGSELRHFTNDLSRYTDLSLELTKDGTSLVAVQVNTDANVFLASNGDAAHARQITSGEPNGFSIAWTPDGKLLTRDAAGHLMLMDASGQQSTVLDDGPVTTVSVCGDGKNVLYSRFKGAEFKIFRTGLDGSGATELIDGALAPSCSPDGKWFTYYHHRGIWRMPIEGGQGKMLVENTGGPGASSISPDGRFVAYYVQEEEGNTYLLKAAVISADGGAILHKIIAPFGVSFLRWAPDGRGLNYLLTRAGAQNLWYQPLDGSPARQVTNFADSEIFDFSWFKDGKQLAVTRGRTRTDVVRISNFSGK